MCFWATRHACTVPPSGGSLEIGNGHSVLRSGNSRRVPPSGGSLEIGNLWFRDHLGRKNAVPPSGGSLEIGNELRFPYPSWRSGKFPLRGDP